MFVDGAQARGQANAAGVESGEADTVESEQETQVLDEGVLMMARRLWQSKDSSLFLGRSEEHLEPCITRLQIQEVVHALC